MADKKLYRSRSNKMLTGLCAGIGYYLNIDPTIVRLITFLLGWFYGIGLVGYIVGSIIVPKEEV